METILELVKLVRINEMSKKIFKAKVINFEEIIPFAPSLSKNRMKEAYRLASSLLKKDIRESLPSQSGFCSVFLLHSYQWFFFVIQKEDDGNLSGIYSQPDGQMLGLISYPSGNHRYNISLNMPKICEKLGVDFKNMGIKVHGITKADSGAVTISRLVSYLFDSKKSLSNEFSFEDIANLRTIHAFVPSIIKKLLDSNKIQETQNLFLGFVNSQMKKSVADDLLRHLHGRLSSFGFVKNELDIFEEATSHVDMTKDKDFCHKIDQLLMIIYNNVKQDIKKYRQKKVQPNTKMHVQKSLTKQKSEECVKKELKKQIEFIFAKDYNEDELFEYIWYRDTLGLKIYVKWSIEINKKQSEEYNRLEKINFISNLCKLAFFQDKKTPLPTIYEVEEEEDYDINEQNTEDVNLSGLQLIDADTQNLGNAEII